MTMRNSVNLLASLLLVCSFTHLHAQNISIIPEPVQLQKKTGAFVLANNTSVAVPKGNAEVTKVAKYFADKVKASSGIDLAITEASTAAIQLQLNATTDKLLGKEGYLLDVSENQVMIRANTAAGLFYGIQSLIQLFPKQIESTSVVNDVKWTAPAVSITDYPRFAYRGIMLDVSRHFYPKEYVKEYIDQIARYKINRFHWHLTDDNGWRLEIKSLPKLTEVGAWRVPRTGTFGDHAAPKPGEKQTYGGFYTQADAKEIIQFAKDRYIEILPEVDVPGHSMAALAAYPDLSVTKDTSVKVNPGSSFATWHGNGKFTMHIDNTLNPIDENVYKFLDKVFSEIAALFPYEYIHIGGDECYKGFWERDPGVQAFMKKNNIKDGVELQSYFTKRVTKMIMDKKKKVIGWDEILEGGLAPGAAVMSWRGTKGGIEAAHQKHDVVMSPNPWYYLDMAQGERSIEPPIYDIARLKTSYEFEVIPAGADSTYILGGQGNLWTEQIPTTHQVEYMTYPRAFALAESFWSPKAKKNWKNFAAKVEDHFERFEAADVNFSTSMYDPIIAVKKGKDNGPLTIELSTEVEGLNIHYAFDNTIPNRYSDVYKGQPLVLPDGADSFRVVTYRDGKPVGHLISFKTEELEKRAR
jgi:hexosaminidase